MIKRIRIGLRSRRREAYDAVGDLVRARAACPYGCGANIRILTCVGARRQCPSEPECEGDAHEMPRDIVLIDDGCCRFALHGKVVIDRMVGSVFLVLV